MKWWQALLIFVGLLLIGVFTVSYSETITIVIIVGACVFFMYALFAVPFYYYKQTEHYKKRMELFQKKLHIKCPHCGYEGPGKKIVKGSFAVEVVLWLFMLLPGMLYTAWRLVTSYFGCPKCSYNFVIKQA